MHTVVGCNRREYKQNHKCGKYLRIRVPIDYMLQSVTFVRILKYLFGFLGQLSTLKRHQHRIRFSNC